MPDSIMINTKKKKGYLYFFFFKNSEELNPWQSLKNF